MFVYWCNSKFLIKDCVYRSGQLKTKGKRQRERRLSESFRTPGCFICDFVYTNYKRRKINSF